MAYNQAGFLSRKVLFFIIGISAFLAAAVMLLPKGFSDDLSKIGKGMAAVVLTHDKSSMRSLELMTLLNKVRSDYADKVEFFVVTINSREGQIFRQRQNVGSIVLIFFSPNGTKESTLDSNMSEMDLRLELDKLSLVKS